MKNKWEKKRFKLENRFIYFSTVCHSLIALDIFAQFDSDDLFLRAVNMSVLFHLLYAAHPHRWSTSIFTDFYKSSRNFAPCPFSFAHLLSHSLVELLDIQILFYLALSHTCMHCQSIIYTIHAGTSSFAWNAHETSWISLSLSYSFAHKDLCASGSQPAIESNLFSYLIYDFIISFHFQHSIRNLLSYFFLFHVFVCSISRFNEGTAHLILS